MLILHHGHSEFLLETSDGFCILTDPFDAHVGYPMKEVSCQAVTVSHAHGDHCFVDKAKGDIAIADRSGRTRLAEGIYATGIETAHDDADGAKRGKNLVFIIECEGLRLAHLGDLGAWDEALVQQLQDIDLMFIPVGGYYTIDHKSAAALVRQTRPRIVIPMHYKTEVNASWPISPLADFLQEMNALNAPVMPLLRVTKEDLSEQPSLIVLADR